MALTSTEQLFIERPLYWCFLRNNHLPYIYFKQKQSLGGVLQNFAKFTGKHQCESLFLIKLQSLVPGIKRPWHRCFPVNFAKFLRTSFLTEHLWWLLLSKMWLVWQFSIFHESSFTEYFLLISFQQKNEIKKGKYPDRVQIFTFFSSIDLFDVKDFERNLTDGNLIEHVF